MCRLCKPKLVHSFHVKTDSLVFGLMICMMRSRFLACRATKLCQRSLACLSSHSHVTFNPAQGWGLMAG